MIYINMKETGFENVLKPAFFMLKLISRTLFYLAVPLRTHTDVHFIRFN